MPTCTLAVRVFAVGRSVAASWVTFPFRWLLRCGCPTAPVAGASSVSTAQTSPAWTDAAALSRPQQRWRRTASSASFALDSNRCAWRHGDSASPSFLSWACCPAHNARQVHPCFRTVQNLPFHGGLMLRRRVGHGLRLRPPADRQQVASGSRSREPRRWDPGRSCPRAPGPALRAHTRKESRGSCGDALFAVARTPSALSGRASAPHQQPARAPCRRVLAPADFCCWKGREAAAHLVLTCASPTMSGPGDLFMRRRRPSRKHALRPF